MVELNQRDRTIKVKIVYYGPALGGKTTNLQVLHERAIWSRRASWDRRTADRGPPQVNVRSQ